MASWKVLTFRSSHQRCSIKNPGLKNFAKLTGKHLYPSLFFNKVCFNKVSFIKKQILVQVFSYEFCQISENTFFKEHLWTTASVRWHSWFSSNCCCRCVWLCVCVCLYSFTCWLLPTARLLWHTWDIRINSLLLWVSLGPLPSFFISVSENVMFHLQRRKRQAALNWRENDMI